LKTAVARLACTKLIEKAPPLTVLPLTMVTKRFFAG
jgi:hypothetical protein